MGDPRSHYRTGGQSLPPVLSQEHTLAVPFQKLSIYQTKTKLVVVGYCKIRGGFQLLRFAKGTGARLDVQEDAGQYSQQEINSLLRQINAANASQGGLQFLAKTHGIIACFRFTDNYYLLLITRKAYVGSICGHKVYKVDGVALLPLSSPSTGAGHAAAATERRYVKLLMAVPLTKNFYFSYTYGLANTLQRNCCGGVNTGSSGLGYADSRGASTSGVGGTAFDPGGGGMVIPSRASGSDATAFLQSAPSRPDFSAPMDMHLHSTAPTSGFPPVTATATEAVVSAFSDLNVPRPRMSSGGHGASIRSGHRVSFDGPARRATTGGGSSSSSAGGAKVGSAPSSTSVHMPGIMRSRPEAAAPTVAVDTTHAAAIAAAVSALNSHARDSSALHGSKSCFAPHAAHALPQQQSTSSLHREDSRPPPDTSAFAQAGAGVGEECVFDSMFTWNSFLTAPLRCALGNSNWCVALVHGFWDQRQVSVFGRVLTMTLVSRRSRHFAGTRYLKRGISEHGHVANEVETEQIVDAGIDHKTGLPLLSALVQVRGSVPLFWAQEVSSLSPKPEIVLQQYDPLFEVTSTHFDNLRARYGNPLVVLNLLKSRERRPRETLLRRELNTAITVLNTMLPPSKRVMYIAWDFAQHAKRSGANILVEMAALTRLALDSTGLFVHNPARLGLRAGPCLSPTHASPGPGWSFAQLAVAPAMAAAAAAASASASTTPRSGNGGGGGNLLSAAHNPLQRTVSFGSLQPPYSTRQKGVLRTNCIDCLDRTNVAQFAFGLLGFGRQLYELGISDTPEVDADSSIAFILMEQFEAMGHTLALSYGGSDAHAAFFGRKKGEWEAAIQGRDVLTSIRRYVSNNYSDTEKQDAINLFLGNFIPQPGHPHLWELDSDQYLHADPWALYNQRTAEYRRQARQYNEAAAARRKAAADAFKLLEASSNNPSPHRTPHRRRTRNPAGTAALQIQQYTVPQDVLPDDGDVDESVRLTRRRGTAPTAAALATGVVRTARPPPPPAVAVPQSAMSSRAVAPVQWPAGAVGPAAAAAASAGGGGRGGGVPFSGSSFADDDLFGLGMTGVPTGQYVLPLLREHRQEMTRVLTQPIITVRPACSVASLSSDDGGGGGDGFDSLPTHKGPDGFGSSSSSSSHTTSTRTSATGGGFAAGAAALMSALGAAVTGSAGMGSSNGLDPVTVGGGSSWDMRGVWGAAPGRGAGGGKEGLAEVREPGAGQSSLLSFDALMMRAPAKAWNIRLHGNSHEKNSQLWQAVQGAFSFFWAPSDPSAATASGTSGASSATAAAAAQQAAQRDRERNSGGGASRSAAVPGGWDTISRRDLSDSGNSAPTSPLRLSLSGGNITNALSPRTSLGDTLLPPPGYSTRSSHSGLPASHPHHYSAPAPQVPRHTMSAASNSYYSSTYAGGSSTGTKSAAIGPHSFLPQPSHAGCPAPVASAGALNRMTATAAAAAAAAADAEQDARSSGLGWSLHGATVLIPEDMPDFMAHHQRNQMGAPTTSVLPADSASRVASSVLNYPAQLLLSLAPQPRPRQTISTLNDILEVRAPAPLPTTVPSLSAKAVAASPTSPYQPATSQDGRRQSLGGAGGSNTRKVEDAGGSGAAHESGSEQDGEWIQVDRTGADADAEPEDGAGRLLGSREVGTDGARYCDPSLEQLLTSDLADLGLDWCLQPWWRQALAATAPGSRVQQTTAASVACASSPYQSASAVLHAAAMTPSSNARVLVSSPDGTTPRNTHSPHLSPHRSTIPDNQQSCASRQLPPSATELPPLPPGPAPLDEHDIACTHWFVSMEHARSVYHDYMEAAGNCAHLGLRCGGPDSAPRSTLVAVG